MPSDTSVRVTLSVPYSVVIEDVPLSAVQGDVAPEDFEELGRVVEETPAGPVEDVSVEVTTGAGTLEDGDGVENVGR